MQEVGIIDGGFGGIFAFWAKIMTKPV